MTVKCTRSITYFKAYLKNGKLRAQIFRFSVLQLVQLCHGLNSWSMMSVRPIFSQTRGFWGLWQNTIIVKQTSNERVTKLVYFGNWIGPYFEKISRFWNDFGWILKKEFSIFWPEKTTKSIESYLSQIIFHCFDTFHS